MPRYRIEIDREKCTGDGWCADQAPETFMVDADDRALVLDPDGNWPRFILDAARGCPADAIRVFDAETGACVWPPAASPGDAATPGGPGAPAAG